MPKCLDPAADAHWRHLLRGFSASGLSVRKFCARHGVSQASFYSQKRQLSASPALLPSSSRPLFVPVRVVGDDPRPSDAAVTAAVPAVASSSSPAEGRIELLLDGGVTVRLCGEVPPARLAAVLGVLGRKGGQSC